MKRIYLYLTPFFPSSYSWRGGYCLDAAKAIARDGRYDVRVFVSGCGEDYEFEGLCVYHMRRIVAPSGTFPFLFSRLNVYFFLHKLKSVGIKADEVAVCHVNTLSYGEYGAYFKKINPNAKAIIQFHESYSISLKSGRLGVIPGHATLLYLYYRRVVENVDILVFISKMSRDTFGKRFVGTPEGDVMDVRSLLLLGCFIRDLRLPPCVIVYNGIDTKLFNMYGRKSHSGFVIGCAANFQPLKDQMTLLKATKLLKSKIPGLKVRFIGSGKTLNSCKRYARDNALVDIVSFEHEIDHSEMPGFYKSLDLFVMPSRLEGFLCVCAESMACGTPAMFCEGTALPELVPEEEKDLWLFKARDVEDLAVKVLSYARDRPRQHFTKDLEIVAIWREFLDRLNNY